MNTDERGKKMRRQAETQSSFGICMGFQHNSVLYHTHAVYPILRLCQFLFAGRRPVDIVSLEISESLVDPEHQQGYFKLGIERRSRPISTFTLLTTDLLTVYFKHSVQICDLFLCQ